MLPHPIKKVNVLIADNQPIFRRGLANYLKELKNVGNVTQAFSGLDLLEKVEMLKPDIVFMDISMIQLNGIDTSQKIKSSSPSTYIAIFDDFDEHYPPKAKQTGADGYLSKCASPLEIEATIEQMAKGEKYDSSLPFIAGIDNNLTNQSGDKLPVAPTHSLSKREVEITKLLCDGFSAKQIAGRLFLFEATVNNHRAHIMRKLGVGNTAGIVSSAHRLRL